MSGKGRRGDGAPRGGDRLGMADGRQTLEAFKNRVLAAADIVDVVEHYVELKKAGRAFVGLCPFHDDSRPSMRVNPDMQIFKCFACGKGGDAISFVREFERVGFMEALEVLAKRYHIEIPELRSAPRDDAAIKHQKAMHEAMDLSVRFYAKRLAHPDHGRFAREYLERRGVSQEMVERFQLGVAPDDWSALSDALKKKGYSDAVLVDAGISRKKRSGDGLIDYLRGRLIFPIHNQRGDVVALSGRVFDKSEPKYINSPDTPLFQKGLELYALNLAREDMNRKGLPAVLAEGYTDVIACHQAGVRTAVASMGTALTPDQARAIKRYTSEAVFLYDADEAGLKAILRGLEILLATGLKVRVGTMPEGEDPDSLAKNHGPEVLVKVIEEAAPFFDFLLARARRQIDPALPESRVEAIEMFRPALAALSEPMVRDGYVARLAEELEHDEGQLRRYLKEHAPRRRPQRSAPARKPAATPAPPQAHPAEMPTSSDDYASDGPQGEYDEEGNFIEYSPEDAAVATPSRREESTRQEENPEEGLVSAGPAPLRERVLLRILIEHADARVALRNALDPHWITHPLVRYYAKALLALDPSVVNGWQYLMAQNPPEAQRDFLERLVADEMEPIDENYLAAAELQVSILKSDYHQAHGRRLSRQLRQVGANWQDGEGRRLIEELVLTSHARLTERERALSENPCVQIRHGE